MRLGKISVSQINPRILIGSAVKGIDDIDYLVEQFAVNSVLSLQSDADIINRQIDMDELVELYQQKQIEFARFSINDFDPDDMAIKLVRPILHLARHVKENKTIFVHCNAGICRAPSTVLAYLNGYENMTLKEGLAFIRQNRPLANPYLDAIEKAIKYLK